MLQSETDDRATALVWELIDELAATGTLRPRSECRELLVRTLDGLLAYGPARFQGHLAWLKSVNASLLATVRDLRGEKAEMQLLGRPEADIPEDEIRTRGFAAGSDQLLVDMLVSPSGLQAIYHVLCHPVDPVCFGD